MDLEAIDDEENEKGIAIEDENGEFIHYEDDDEEAVDQNQVKQEATISSSESIDPDLVATIAALGSYEIDKYVKGPECAICIVDIIKFLRIENKSLCNIRLQIAKSECMEKDLLPIFTTYPDDDDIFEAMVRLLVNVTMSSLLCMENENNKMDKKQKTTIVLDINNYLREYKELFLKFNVMKYFSSKLSTLLVLGRTNRSADDDMLLERILIIIRNILHVPCDSEEEANYQYSASTHDKLVLSIIEYGIAELLMYLCGSTSEEQHCILSLEIINLLFRDFDAETLAQSNPTEVNNNIDNELKALKEKEDLIKKKGALSRRSRHSRFGGTYVMLGKKSITDKDLIYHKDIKKIKDMTFDSEKTIQRHTRFNEIAEDRSSKRFSTPQVRNHLRELGLKFLDVCYNRLMKKVKGLLCRSLGTANDESFYMWSCKFFMEFNRCTNFKIELVAETLSIDTFSYILQIIFKFHEDVKSLGGKKVEEKRKVAKRLHNSVRAYREMLENLSLMVMSKDPKIKNIGNVIENTIFYQQEYRELPTLLLKQFHTRFFTKTYLADLVECTHLYVRMLETYSKTNTLIVQETKRKKSQTKSKKKKKRKNMLSEAELVEMWQGDIEQEVISVLSSGSITTDHVRPFDGSADYSMEQQRVLCKHKIQDLLKSGSFDEAVAMYKAAKDVWPESASFGYPDMSIMDEVNVMKSIFTSNEEVPDMRGAPEDGDNQEQVTRSEYGEGTEVYAVKENKYSNNEYLMLYARPGIVQAYCHLLQFFETNTASVNHATVKMLYRISAKLAMSPLMYQITFFITLRKILSAPKVEEFKELQKFAIFIVRKFVVALKESPLIAVDSVFWKGPDDVLMIDNQYDESKLPTKKVKVTWTPAEEEEVKELYGKWIDKAHAIDLCEMIAQDMTTGEKHRMEVKKKIIELKLVEGANADILNKKPKSKMEWLPDEREALRSLYDEFKYERDPVSLIQEKLDTKSRKKIIKELESLMGIRKKDLDVNRVIWTKDDDEELIILYKHLSESHIGNALLDAIVEKIPKPRTSDEVKEALIRLKLRRDHGSSSHFWTTAELKVLEDIGDANSKDIIECIKAKLFEVEYDEILKKLVHIGKLSQENAAKLLLEVDVSDDEDQAGSDDDVEDDEDDFDFFDIPKIVARLSPSKDKEILWISGVISTALTNREDLFDFDTVFIIPRTDSQKAALSHHDFRQLLQCLGAAPPLSSFETYWKISGDVSTNILRKGYEMLTGKGPMSASDGEGSVAPPQHHESSGDESDDDMDVFLDKLRAQKPSVAKEGGGGGSDKENASGEDEPSEGVVKKRTTLSDSESESEIDGVRGRHSKRKKGAALNFSDSDE